MVPTLLTVVDLPKDKSFDGLVKEALRPRDYNNCGKRLILPWKKRLKSLKELQTQYYRWTQMHVPAVAVIVKTTRRMRVNSKTPPVTTAVKLGTSHPPADQNSRETRNSSKKAK